LPDFSTFARHALDFLTQKGTIVAAFITAVAFVLAVSRKSTERILERIADWLVTPENLAAEQRLARANDLLARLGSRPSLTPSPPFQRRLRNRQRHAARRLEEVRTIWRRQRRTASWASFINGLLVAAHYLVGATLASSFVQRSLSPNLTGTLGLVVVIASTIQQRYTPDLVASTARERAGTLQSAVLDAEDALVEANREDDGTDFQRISRRLSAIISATQGNSHTTVHLRARQIEKPGPTGEVTTFPEPED
jgi:hypothetical protein